MRTRRTLAFFVFAICVLAAVVKDRAAEVRSGDWTISKSDFPGKVEFSLIEHHNGGMSNHQSLWPVSVFQGLDVSKAARQEVNFTITRDAGKIECEGFLKDGEGAGLFHFQPDLNYPRQMESLGFPLDEEKQFAMAVQDVTLDFAKEMKGQHLGDLDTDKLVAFRIFGVDSAFIEAMHAEGLKTSDSDKFVAFRIHGVTPQMVRTLHQAGYSPDEDTLIALRIHGATPEWMTQIKQRGYDHLDLEKMIAFRIHGVSPEFIDKIQGLGYSHPDPDELIAMRIHNVTPEYIADMRSRGIKDLSIDKLVSMRIHGID
ncbi:MAG TPA: hypothetical protein VHW45_08895 [Candidatus Sulfotelmatobacter sp.]|nr:hypothetical protein [Candidatus Sulfotelmatobacter sp.]